MSTLFLLIRHGHTDVIGRRITGRLPGVSLDSEGEQQAKKLGRLRVDAIVSSPLERTMQTAAPLSACLNLPVQQCEALSEVDFGEWSGLTLAELEPLPEWKLFNTFRSSVRPPGGELMLEVQARIVTALGRIASDSEGRTVAAFSHADVIKAAVLHYLGAPLDMLHRLDISPGSLTRIRMNSWGPTILSVNEGC